MNAQARKVEIEKCKKAARGERKNPRPDYRIRSAKTSKKLLVTTGLLGVAYTKLSQPKTIEDYRAENSMLWAVDYGDIRIDFPNLQSAKAFAAKAKYGTLVYYNNPGWVKA